MTRTTDWVAPAGRTDCTPTRTRLAPRGRGHISNARGTSVSERPVILTDRPWTVSAGRRAQAVKKCVARAAALEESVERGRDADDRPTDSGSGARVHG